PSTHISIGDHNSIITTSPSFRILIGITTQSLQPRQAPASQSGTTFQPPLSRQAPATLLSSQEMIETVPSRLQSQQSAHLEIILSQESITSGAKPIITVTNTRTLRRTYSRWRL